MCVPTLLAQVRHEEAMIFVLLDAKLLHKRNDLIFVYYCCGWNCGTRISNVFLFTQMVPFLNKKFLISSWRDIVSEYLTQNTGEMIIKAKLTFLFRFLLYLHYQHTHTYTKHTNRSLLMLRKPSSQTVINFFLYFSVFIDQKFQQKKTKQNQ